MRSLSPIWTSKRLIAVAALALAPAPALAHPSRGIAVDRNGTIVFSDLVRIWRIEGNRLRLVRSNPDTHTHAMIVDARGDLVWEESAYDPASQGYSETIWQLSGNRLTRRFGPLRRLPRGLGIARDRHGCTFHSDWVGRAGPSLVHRLCPGRAPVRLFGSASDDARYRPALVSDVAGVALAADGSFVFRHGTTVRSVTAARQVRVLATDIAPENYGIALDGSGGLLVAENRNRRILRFSGGRREVVAVSAPGWAPTGVAARGGAIVVLEASDYRQGQPARMRVTLFEGGARPRTLAQVTVPQP